MFCMSHIGMAIKFPSFMSHRVSCFCHLEQWEFTHSRHTVCDHLVCSLLMNFSFIFIFKMIYAYFWVCFGFVFAKINCTFMFAMAHAKHIFTVSISCLWFRLSLFLMSQCLKDVLHVSNLKGNEIS